MSEDNNNENIIEDIDEESGIQEEQDLLFTTEEGGIRAFALNNVTGASFVGILVEETEDSFLVGIPCKIVKETSSDVISIEEMLPVPYARFLKSGILAVMHPFYPLAETYLKYLKEISYSRYPEFIDSFGFGPDGEGLGDVPVQEFREEVETEATEASEGVPHSTAESEGELITPSNMTQADLKRKIKDSINNGSLITNYGDGKPKLPN